MAVLGNRRDASPIVISPDGALSKPKRIPFTQKKIDEEYIQKLIEKNPDMLPVSEIEPVFSPLITIGYEVPTKSGPMDLLLLSSQGYLAIVETKLWRNPEARREVVGQLVDYAKDVSQWSFEDLESKVRAYNKIRYKNDDGIIASLQRFGEIDETTEGIITDTIIQNLRNGRFLLLVVGDGIRKSLEEMADYLQKTPQLQFTLALVELQIYELNDGTQLLLPQVVARTREITRAIVRVEGKDIDSIKIDVDTKMETSKEPPKRFTITEEAFFKALNQNFEKLDIDFAHQLIQDMVGLGCAIEWKQASFVVTLEDPGGSGKNFSLLVVEKNGQIHVRNEFYSQLGDLGLPKELASDYARESARLFVNCQVKYYSYWSRTVSLSELRQRYPEFKNVIEKIIDRIKQATNE